MCGIFGIISKRPEKFVHKLSKLSEVRGRDSAGLFFEKVGTYNVSRQYCCLTALVKNTRHLTNSHFIMGHSRLVTNGMADNQPVFRDNMCLIHNGIVVNDEDLWKDMETERYFQIDSEVILALTHKHLESGGSLEEVSNCVLSACKGVVACALALPALGKVILFSNNGSLYSGSIGQDFFFASERFSLHHIGCENIDQIRQPGLILDIPKSLENISLINDGPPSVDLIPSLGSVRSEEIQLEYKKHSLRRCSKCILPETMPFISFDGEGVCNYCRAYRPRNHPRPFDELLELVKPYRKTSSEDCIVPFSGGRDSCYSLHLICNELKMKPIAYTYDWGMVTDLGRRNISRMCASLGVENIIIADDIKAKRRNIAANLKAWLRSPNLGMVSILTAGDKHFFRHVETVKRQTGISLNLWGVNPLEVTHFKAGFLGIPPNFAEERVYSSGAMKQLRYQWLRLKAMAASPSYFNSSLWDTLSGEYYRSFHKKTDYFHLFDYWRWDEKEVDNTLINHYDWETAPDTNTTWRIGDGTAAIYNYIYYTVAGFTEHDTFRSNQIREGDLTREEALELVADENLPRYPNIKWYLDAIGMDFDQVIPVINSIPKLKPEAWQ